MNVLIACEFSGIVRDAFLARGHNAMSCDLLPTENPGPHYQGDILDILGWRWDLLIAHPECRFLANSGAKHLYKGMKKTNGRDLTRWANMQSAAAFFNKLRNCRILKKAIENPIMHGHAKALIGQQSQLLQPWQHGHKEMKAICLWLENLPLLRPTDIIGPPPKNPDERKKWARIHRMTRSPTRGKDRSRFYTGVAEAMADQWGGA